MWNIATPMCTPFRYDNGLNHQLTIFHEDFLIVCNHRWFQHEAIEMNGRFRGSAKRFVVPNGEVNRAQKLFVLSEISGQPCFGIGSDGKFCNIASITVVFKNLVNEISVL
jgi:hypothetical protein